MVCPEDTKTPSVGEGVFVSLSKAARYTGWSETWVEFTVMRLPPGSVSVKES